MASVITFFICFDEIQFKSFFCSIYEPCDASSKLHLFLRFKKVAYWVVKCWWSVDATGCIIHVGQSWQSIFYETVYNFCRYYTFTVKVNYHIMTKVFDVCMFILVFVRIITRSIRVLTGSYWQKLPLYYAKWALYWSFR